MTCVGSSIRDLDDRSVFLMISLTMFCITPLKQFPHLPNCNIRSMAASEPPHSWRRPGSWLEELLDDPASPWEWLVKGKQNEKYSHLTVGQVLTEIQIRFLAAIYYPPLILMLLGLRVGDGIGRRIRRMTMILVDVRSGGISGGSRRARCRWGRWNKFKSTGVC